MYTYEVCANSVRSCLAAQEAKAHRVELCAALPEGGTTPSYGEIATARELLSIKMHVIIRPRGGDFLYSPVELKCMLRDIEMCRKLGVDGVVFGCLTKNGDINLVQIKEMIAASQGMSVTFHRAFDLCRNPQEALEQIIKLGCDRILTSGQQITAVEGIPLLKKLNKQAAGRITLLAGAGVNAGNIKKIAMETGINEFHFSARTNYASEMQFRNTEVSMGGTVRIDEYQLPFTTPEKVKEIIQSLESTNP